MTELEAFLRARCLPPSGPERPPLLPLAAELEAGEAFGLAPRELEAAAERAALVNPAVDFEAAPRRLEAGEAARALPGAAALVDALDGIGDRLSLAAAASAAGVAFVHAAVAGPAGQACVQAPGAADLGRLYPAGGPERGVERSLGNQAFAPAFAAALEVSELCRLILGGEGRGLSGRCLFFDLAVPEFILMEG